LNVSEERLTRVEFIFQAAADLPPADRAAFLGEHCGDNPALRDLVEDLLERHDGGMGGFLKPDATDRIRLEETPGPRTFDRVGPYRLQDRIGCGGMGEVWTAEQLSPVRRTVALKLIKAGMDSRQVLARFEAERQALALMDHPYIAKVFDAGVTELGHPYFVMEHVPGVPIADYCDQHRLDTKERLKLFERVCEGVQHAHQKAVIHRDIKPANILVVDVDGQPLPRIIDFGVAKATTQKLSEKTIHTALGQIIGTPEYMSPEQADLASEDVDTRTDVYSLGVVLYELLVGALPFDPDELRKAGFEGFLKMLRERDPPRPSTKISTLGEKTTEIARARRTEPHRLAGQLKGDLDWIVMRSLEKDRRRRYGSPGELAQDIRRHLSDQPVLARPPSAVYRSRKFVKRHQVGVGFAAMGCLAVGAGLIVVAVQQAEIKAARDEAMLVTTSIEEMLTSVDPTRRGRDVSVREMLDETARTLGEKFQDQPLVESRLRLTVGNTYYALGEHGAAVEHLLRAVEIRRERFGEEDLGTLEARNDLARAYLGQGLTGEAEALSRETLELARRGLGQEHPETLDSMSVLANASFSQGRSEEAEALFRQTLDIQRRVFGEEHPNTLISMGNLAVTYSSQDRHGEAEVLERDTLETQRRILGEEHPSTLLVAGSLATTYAHQGRYEEAEILQRETLEIQRRVLGEEHPSTLRSMGNLASTYKNLGRYDAAEALRRETLEIHRRVHGEGHPSTLYTMEILAALYKDQGRYDEAEALQRGALEISRRVLGEEHSKTLHRMDRLAAIFRAQGRLDQAEELRREILEISRRVLGEDHPTTNGVRYNLACQAAARGDRDEAIAILREALDNGYRQSNMWILDDPELATLHGDREFEAIVEELSRRNEEPAAAGRATEGE
jgi:serine/threonine protein kinase/tetratricopeptide (TPR) repeat protein